MLVTSIFLLFPQCFEKASFPDTSKGFNVWERIKAVSFVQFDLAENATMLVKGALMVDTTLKLRYLCLFFSIKHRDLFH